MNGNSEKVRSLEQQESGEIRNLRCAACGARVFGSLDLARHQSACEMQAERAIGGAGRHG